MWTLDLSMDYSRLIGTPVSQSFALRTNRHRGAIFVGWFSRQLENRNHVAYLDTQHNDLQSVHLNIFLNFALTAMKIPHYFGMANHLSPQQAKLVVGSLLMAVEYTHNAGRARVLHAARAEVDDRQYGVRKVDFSFLAETAILQALSKKASRFKSIVHLLTVRLQGKAYRGMALRHESVVARGWAAIRRVRY